MYRNTGRVDLNETGVSEVSTLAVSLQGSGAVATHSVGGEEVGVAVSAGSEADSVSRVALELAGYQILGNDTACATVDDDDVLHLGTRVELYSAAVDLFHQRGVSTEQQLLTGLTLGIERTANLHTTERAVGEHATILTCERHTLCDALVDDVCADLSQTIDVGLTCAIVTTFDCIVEQTVDAVTVVLVVLCSIDTTLGSDRVSAAG